MNSISHKRYTKQQLDDLNGITSNRHGFIFPFILKDITEEMSQNEIGIFFKAVLLYVEQNAVMDFDKRTMSYYALKQFISQYDKDAEKYLAKVSQLRESGAKGGKAGRPKESEANA